MKEKLRNRVVEWEDIVFENTEKIGENALQISNIYKMCWYNRYLEEVSIQNIIFVIQIKD